MATENAVRKGLQENGRGVFQALSWRDSAKSRITQSRHPVCRPSSNSEPSEFVRPLLRIASRFIFTREQRKMCFPCAPHEDMRE